MKMKTWNRHLTILVAMVCLMAFVAGCGGDSKPAAPSATGAGEKVTLKLAHNLPITNHMARGMENFAKKVSEKSKGSVTVQIYPSGQLYNDKSMNDALMAGGIDIGLNSTAMWASVIPVMEIFDVPFLFPSYEKVAKALEGGVGEKLAGEMEKKGVRPLIWVDYGFVQFANSKRPLTKPEDFKGLKLRGYGELPSETIKALGAAPVTMGAGEVYMALQRNTIDGQTSGTTAMMDRKMYEVSKYLTITNHAFPEFIATMNLKSWNKLSADQKKAVQEAAKEVEKALNGLKEKGMQVYVVPENEIAAWQKATESVHALFIKRTGDVGKQMVDFCKNLK
jgi:tripartite ATP-independent transporter DctP family solute receptor